VAIKKASIQASKKLDEVLRRFECYDHQHAIAILTRDYPILLSEISDVLLDALNDSRRKSGGMIEATSQSLQRLGWHQRELEIRLTASGKRKRSETYKLDYTKGAVACAFDEPSEHVGVHCDLDSFRELLRRDGIAVKVAVGATFSKRGQVFGTEGGGLDVYPRPTLFVAQIRRR
jgi:hypothetical protein